MNSTRRDFLKTTGAAAIGIGLLPAFAGRMSDVFAPAGLARMSPESQGVSSAAISKFINAANASGLQWHGFMLLRHGNVIAEGWWKPFDFQYRHTLYSLSKSFTSTAIGLLVKEGKLKVDEPVISLFPEDLPVEVSDNLKQMKVKHLLTMNTGHGEDTTGKMREGTAPWTKTFLSLPVEHAPGSHFLYNTGATYMLGAIVHKVSGQDVETFLSSRLFKPLGITGYDWEKSPQGLSVAGWGLRITTEDIAKFGQLYLQKGKWNDKTILTESWVNEATSAQTTSNPGDGDWSQGYGYQFWRCKPGFFRGDGAFGQYCIVMPQYDAVLAVNSESWDMQKQMTIAWETLLPAMQASALPESATDQQQLKQDLANLSLPVVKGSVTSALAKKYNGAEIKFGNNEFGVTSMQLKFSDDGCTWTAKTAKGAQVIKTGWEKWATNKESMKYLFSVGNRNPVPSKVAATATWINENTLQLNLRFIEAIHGDKITCVFDGNKVSVSFLNSVSENTKNNTEKRGTLEGTV
ncbi:beta-lactamase family protein [Fulvivirgaceae bacterium PWU4]|uniref:Beta-lactamase family protein n=1 Tax=Chryseosolibacter histidini TaxID=2782349 RepID=A0AAP2DTG0_9BACT|nr:serine hydrolase [Chryseosolibacter histidini]MBT1700259.1 beta-lactamase family protein [Chryseosolibacter histidini]